MERSMLHFSSSFLSNCPPTTHNTGDEWIDTLECKVIMFQNTWNDKAIWSSDYLYWRHLWTNHDEQNCIHQWNANAESGYPNSKNDNFCLCLLMLNPVHMSICCKLVISYLRYFCFRLSELVKELNRAAMWNFYCWGFCSCSYSFLTP